MHGRWSTSARAARPAARGGPRPVNARGGRMQLQDSEVVQGRDLHLDHLAYQAPVVAIVDFEGGVLLELTDMIRSGRDRQQVDDVRRLYTGQGVHKTLEGTRSAETGAPGNGSASDGWTASRSAGGEHWDGAPTRSAGVTRRPVDPAARRPGQHRPMGGGGVSDDLRGPELHARPWLGERVRDQLTEAVGDAAYYDLVMAIQVEKDYGFYRSRQPPAVRRHGR